MFDRVKRRTMDFWLWSSKPWSVSSCSLSAITTSKAYLTCMMSAVSGHMTPRSSPRFWLEPQNKSCPHGNLRQKMVRFASEIAHSIRNTVHFSMVERPKSRNSCSAEMTMIEMIESVCAITSRASCPTLKDLERTIPFVSLQHFRPIHCCTCIEFKAASHQSTNQ